MTKLRAAAVTALVMVGAFLASPASAVVSWEG